MPFKAIRPAAGTRRQKGAIKTATGLMTNHMSGKAGLARTNASASSLIMPETKGNTALSVVSLEEAKKRSFNSENARLRIYMPAPFGRGGFYNAVVAYLQSALLRKSAQIGKHCERIAVFAGVMGEELGFSEREREELELFALMHDIGKIEIPAEILDKPGRLDESEWRQIKRHSELGYSIAMGVPCLAPIAEDILYHHERWDGEGYPAGLKGEETPLFSRIIAVADAYDAMTSDRPYRKHVSEEAAAEEIIINAGTQFDPYIAEVFVSKVLCRQ